MLQLVVGLGNPGENYRSTRHNIGFMAVDAIAEEFGAGTFKKKHHGYLSHVNVNTHALMLFKPDTFMNRSGLAVSDLARFYKIPPEAIVVLHDELDLPLGKIRVKQGGGDGGHNGLKSLDSHVGSNYYRVRIGIDRPNFSGDVSDYVLSPFYAEEREKLIALLDGFLKAFPLLLEESNGNRFMTKIAQLLTPEKTLTPEKKKE